MDVSLENDDHAEQLKALEVEADRIGKLPVRKAERGIRMCSTQEAREKDKAKILLCLDQKVELSLEGKQLTFGMQDIFKNLLEAMGADWRTLPVPPSRKERKLRKTLDNRRKKVAKKGPR